MSDYGRADEAGSVRFERLLPGPIERVWAHLVDSDLRSTWFAGGPLEPRVGGKVTLHFAHSNLAPPGERIPAKWRTMEDEPITAEGRVTRFEPLRALAFTWAGDTSEVTFELEPAGDEVRLTLTHRRLAKREERVGTSAGWHVHLDLLGERLRGEPRRPFWSRVEHFDREYEARLAKD